MKKLLFTLAFSFLSFKSHAATINCQGSYLIYKMQAQAVASGTKIIGDVAVAISYDTSITKLSLTPSSSDVRTGQYIRMSGTNSQGQGQLSTTFDRTTGNYVGTLTTNSAFGNISIPVSCSMTGTLSEEDVIEIY